MQGLARHKEATGPKRCPQKVQAPATLTLSAPAPAQAAGMTLRAGTTRDWKLEFISNLLLAFAFAYLGASLFLDLQLFVTDRLSRLLVLFERFSSGR